MTKQSDLNDYVEIKKAPKKKYVPPKEKLPKVMELSDSFKELTKKFYGGEPSIEVQNKFCYIMLNDKLIAKKIVDNTYNWSKTLKKDEKDWETSLPIYSKIVSSIDKILENGGSTLTKEFLEASDKLLKMKYQNEYDRMLGIERSVMDAKEYMKVLDRVSESAKYYFRYRDTEEFFRNLYLTQVQRDKLIKAHKGPYGIL